MFESDFCNRTAGWGEDQIEKDIGNACYLFWHDAGRLMMGVKAKLITGHGCISSRDHSCSDLYTRFPIFILLE